MGCVQYLFQRGAALRFVGDPSVDDFIGAQQHAGPQLPQVLARPAQAVARAREAQVGGEDARREDGPPMPRGTLKAAYQRRPGSERSVKVRPNSARSWSRRGWGLKPMAITPVCC